MKKITGRTWLTLILVGLVGQLAWTIENMYFNVYLYNTISTDPSYISGMVGWSAAAATLTTLLMGALSDRLGKRKAFICAGYILWGILLTWILGMIAQACGWYVVDPAAGANSLFPDFSNGIGISAPYLFAFNFDYISSHLVEFAVIVFAFLFVDLFDTAGTVIGVANKGGMLDENGDLPRAKQVLLADAVGTVVGSCLGTSTVTSFVESSAGVAAGGRTGLASVATGVLFLVALVLAPIFLAIPSFATTPALVFVGFLMMSSVKDMDWSEDSAAAVGGFLAIIMMPFTYSIANGIMFGILAFVVIRIFQGRVKEVHWVMWVSTALFVLRIITLVV